MAQYSDLFIAPPGDAPQLAAAGDPFSRWYSVSIKDVLELEWLALAKVMRTEVFDEPLDEGKSHVVRPMARHVVQRLLALTDAERRSLAEAWKTEAQHLSAWPVEALERVLQELKELAGRASREGKAVLYLAKG